MKHLNSFYNIFILEKYKFLYNKITINSISCCRLIHLADKFGSPTLLDKCMDILKSDINLWNFPEVVYLSKTIYGKQISQFLSEFTLKNIQNIFKGSIT